MVTSSRLKALRISFLDKMKEANTLPKMPKMATTVWATPSTQNENVEPISKSSGS